jgi:hypothetical protein
MSDLNSGARHQDMQTKSFAIHADSHLDHLDHLLAHEREQLFAWLDERFVERRIERANWPRAVLQSDLRKPIVATFTGSPVKLYSDLRGPSCGDREITEDLVQYRVRPGRRNTTRALLAFTDDLGGVCWNLAQLRTVDVVTVVIGEHAGQERVLFTVYGGQPAPREPGDTAIASWEELEASRKFWAVHALV